MTTAEKRKGLKFEGAKFCRLTLHPLPRHSLLLLTFSLVAMGIFSKLSTSASGEKRISVYSGVASYSLPVFERSGHDYVGLLEILEPLGLVTAKTQGRRWKIRFRNIEGEFSAGKTQARIHGKELDLPYDFLIQNGRGLVPVASLVNLLLRFTDSPVLLHENARRLFIGNAATQFTATLMKTTPPRLVLNFSAPVNPTISTEQSGVSMLFRREPLIQAGTQTLTFSDNTIPSAIYREDNGAAEITVAGNQPLMAVFSNDGRTITIAPAPQPSPATAVKASPPASPRIPEPPVTSSGDSVRQMQLPALVASSPATTAQFLAVIDASHGGDDRGAALTPALPEKDVTLAIARRLRQELQNLAVSVLMIRDADLSLPMEQRAGMANMARASVYICIHVSSQGPGVRLYRSAIASTAENRGPFVSWDSAQAPLLPSSQALLGDVSTELQKKTTVRILSAPLRPLNNIVSPAVAVELAPRGNDILDVASPDYQQNVATAVALGVAGFRDRSGARP